MNDPEVVDALLQDAPDLMTSEEVATLLRVNPVTVSRWMREHGLKGISIGARLKRFRKVDVREFLLRGDEISEVSTSE